MILKRVGVVMATCMLQRHGLHLEVFMMSLWQIGIPLAFSSSQPAPLQGFSSGMLPGLTLLACCGPPPAFQPPPKPSKLREIHSCLREFTPYRTYSKVQLGVLHFVLLF